jgi:hypothetical protein
MQMSTKAAHLFCSPDFNENLNVLKKMCKINEKQFHENTFCSTLLCMASIAVIFARLVTAWFMQRDGKADRVWKETVVA